MRQVFRGLLVDPMLDLCAGKGDENHLHLKLDLI